MRVETGTIKFGEDWPATILRGDNAVYYGQKLSYLLDKIAEQNTNVNFIELLILRGLANLLINADVRLNKDEVNFKCKPIEECLISNSEEEIAHGPETIT